ARSPAIGDPARATFRVLAEMLGSSSASLLYRRLRNEKGLAYSFHAWERGYTEAGAWRLLVGIDRGNGPEADKVIRELIQRIANGDVPIESLNAAKRQAEMHVIVAAEDPLELAQTIADYSLTEPDDWSAGAEIERLREVSGAEVVKAAADILDGLVMAIRPED